MSICTCRLRYGLHATPDQQLRLRALILRGGPPVFTPDGGCENAWDTLFVDFRDLLPGDLAMFDDITPAFGRRGSEIEDLPRASVVVNKQVHVAVPGNGLLEMKDVLLLADACTDVLRSHLADGWQIIAVCPQPDQRRPDYVLGARTQRY